jgi:hypothetical protein
MKGGLFMKYIVSYFDSREYHNSEPMAKAKVHEYINKLLATKTMDEDCFIEIYKAQ